MTATVEAPVIESTEEPAEVPLAERMAALPIVRPNDVSWGPHGHDSVRRVTLYAPAYRQHEPISVLATRRTGSSNTWVLLVTRHDETLWAMGWGLDADVSRVVRDRYPYTRGVFVFHDDPDDSSRVFDIGEPLPITAAQADEGVEYLAVEHAERGGNGPAPVPFPVVVNDEKTGWKHAVTGAFHRGSGISIVDFGAVEEPPTDPVERAEWERDKAQRELTAFKALVAKRLVDETNSRNWCSEAEGWLRSLGLEPPPQRYRVTVTLFVEDATSTENALAKAREEFGNRIYEMGSARLANR